MTHIPDLKRRSFLIGGTAAGLACGYVAVEGISTALAAGAFGPTAWYSIGPDGIVTVMVGKAEMGQHVSSAMCQIVAHMDGNLCRCMTYGRIQKAIVRAAADMRARSGS